MEMEGQSGGAVHPHPVEIDVLVASMESKLEEKRAIPHGTPRCIFKVATSVPPMHRRPYQPEIVSIGPYYHGDARFKMAEAHKWRFLSSLLARNLKNNVHLQDCVNAIRSLEPKIRGCYDGALKFQEPDELVEIIVLDGCFIIELLLRINGCVGSEEKDCILAKRWTLPILMRDLIKVENQIPYFALQCLFDLLKEGSRSQPLITIILALFNRQLGRPDGAHMPSCQANPPCHLLDFLRSILIPSGAEAKNISIDRKRYPLRQPDSESLPKNIHCATVIRKMGIKVRAGKFLGLSNIQFEYKSGILEIPYLVIDNFSRSVLLNCIAYEQSYSGQGILMYINAYAAILDALVNSAEDVRLLRDKNVIEHFYGTDDEVAVFCNDLGKAFPLDAGMQFLGGLFDDINTRCIDRRRVQWAGFKQTYFGTLWIFFSALAAFILLLLTLIQTFFSAFGYFRPPS